MALGAQPSLPAAPQEIPGLPENASFIEFSGWDGIDTKPPRPGVDENHVAWCDNLMPLGKNNIRAVPDLLPAIYTAPGGLQIEHYDFFGLQPGGVNTGPYGVYFLSDGSCVQQSINTLVVTQIAPAGTFQYPGGALPAVRQFGTTYLLITTAQNEDSYWVWDGSILYTSGSISPETTITDGGVGYTSAPTVDVVGGSGSGIGFTATVQDGSVVSVSPTAAGSGFLVSDAPNLLLLFSGGGSGISAHGLATVVNGAIVSATIVSGGSGFTSVPTIVISDPTGTGAAIVVTGINGGVITSLQVTVCGSGYTDPSIATSGGGGSGFSGTVATQNGVIDGVTMTSVGAGYGEAPQVIFIAPTGSGASATAILSAGTITGISFGASQFTGQGYSGQVLVGFTGGSGPAAGTVLLMPFGVSGTTIEVYQSRVWIGTTVNKVKGFFSVSESVANFDPSLGGGIFPATESNLRYQWTRFIQSNGFLYLIGDSSVSYISGVSSAGTPIITTFSNLNIDPQLGSPWRDSVIEYSRAIMLSNNFGVLELNGGAVQKASTALDGVFNSGVTAGIIGNVRGGPSSAIATIFGVHVYVLLMPMIDPITAAARNILFMWDGKRWWTASQSVPLIKISTLEWGSDINAYGTDGQSIYELFQAGSTATVKTLKSRLSVQPSIAIQKKGWMLYALWKSTQPSTLNFSIDTESTSAAVTQGAFVGNVNAEATWARSKAPDSLGFAMGFTMTSTGADFTLIDLLLIVQDRRLKT